MDLSKIIAEFNVVALARQWRHLHTPKNLATAVAVEAGELLAHFQWLPADFSGREALSVIEASKYEKSMSEGAESERLYPDKSAVAGEIADVFMYLLMLADKMDIPFEQAIFDKIESNRRRFGVVDL